MRYSTILATGAIIIGLAMSAHAQSGPPSPEVRALQATNNELMQAWVGARTALTATQDQLTIAQHKIEELQNANPRVDPGNQPMKLPHAAVAPTPETPAEKAP